MARKRQAKSGKRQRGKLNLINPAFVRKWYCFERNGKVEYRVLFVYTLWYTPWNECGVVVCGVPLLGKSWQRYGAGAAVVLNDACAAMEQHIKKKFYKGKKGTSRKPLFSTYIEDALITEVRPLTTNQEKLNANEHKVRGRRACPTA